MEKIVEPIQSFSLKIRRSIEKEIDYYKLSSIFVFYQKKAKSFG